MSEITWPKFVKLYSQQNGLTYAQSLVYAKQPWADYKNEQLQVKKEEIPRKKQPRKIEETDSDSESDSASKSYKYVYRKTKKKAVKPKGKRMKKKVIYVTDSDTDSSD